MNDTTSSSAPDNGVRRRRLLLLSAIVVVGLSVYAAYWFLHGRYFESTDDAYVAADLVPITSEVAGTVTALHVDDTEHVERGQVLVELDPADAELAVATAEAELARTVRQVRGLFAQTAGLDAQIREREVALSAARADLKRRTAVGEGAVSAEELAHAREQVARFDAALAAAREQRATTLAQVEGTDIESHPQVAVAAAKLREASLALRRTKILAPVSGVVAKRGVQLGARIAAGAPLMAVVPLDEAWVDANFKEAQLEQVRVGQPVELHADLYGRDVVYHGRVAGLSAGSGAAFALLPAQNASGNWIKIVQRVPVRIQLDAKELAEHPLRVGLSMHAEIDLHEHDGAPLASTARRAPAPLPVLAVHDDAVDARVAAIIKANRGSDAL